MWIIVTIPRLVLRNPPKGDRREAVLFCEIGDSEGFDRLYFAKSERYTFSKMQLVAFEPATFRAQGT